MATSTRTTVEYISYLLGIAVAYIILVLLGAVGSPEKWVQLVSMAVVVLVSAALTSTTDNALYNTAIGACIVLFYALYLYVPAMGGVAAGIGVLVAAFFILVVSGVLGGKAALTSASMLLSVSLILTIVFVLAYVIIYILQSGSSVLTLREGVVYVIIALSIAAVAGFLYRSPAAGRVLSTAMNAGEAGALDASVRLLILEGLVMFGVFTALPYLTGIVKTQRGHQLTEPGRRESLMTRQILASSEDLTGGDASPGYKHALSFWVFLNSDQQTIARDVEIFSYGTNPMVTYNPARNSMMFLAQPRRGDSPSQSEAQQRMIIGTVENVKLQKWTNVTLNYVNGTMDVFYDGELVASRAAVVPYVPDDVVSIGTEGVLRGNIANVLYFRHTLDATGVKKISILNGPPT
jgi:hypothetical protein